MNNTITIPISFTDQFGTIHSEGYCDGSNITVTLRNIEFTGSSFNLLSFKESDRTSVNDSLMIDKHGDISGIFTIELPLMIEQNGDISVNQLLLQFDYLNNKNDIFYLLSFKNNIYTDSKSHGCVEDILIALQKQLDVNQKLQCCMACCYSSYHPVGNNDFGGLACFKQINDDELLEIIDKCSLMDMWEREYHADKIKFVQETHLCSDFNDNSTINLYKSF